MRYGRFAFLASAAGVLYSVLLRQPILTWGASAEEAAQRLPGDELLEDADGVSTRAIDIQAPVQAVWPWLAQMGPSPRGGAYTYDWIENLLGLNMHSTDRVLPDYQHPDVDRPAVSAASAVSGRLEIGEGAARSGSGRVAVIGRIRVPTEAVVRTPASA
jgi:hypothetical protein